MIHGVGHALLYRHMRRYPTATPTAGLAAALDTCRRPPKEFEVYFQKNVDHGDGRTAAAACACGTFHAFFRGLSPELSELAPEQRNISSWRDICARLILAAGCSISEYGGACDQCGRKLTEGSVGAQWSRSRSRPPALALSAPPPPQEQKP